jgi:putative ABC transport system permease protein
MIPTRNEFAEKYTKLRDKLRTHSSIASVTTSSFKPGEAGQINFYKAKDIEGLSGDDAVVVDAISVGLDFEKTFGLDIVSGRSFAETFKTDLEQAIVVNEAAVRKFRWVDPIGKTISSSGEAPKRVIGVIKDFHYKSLKEEMVPVILSPTDKASRFIAIRLNAGDVSSAISQVQSEWHEIIPELPFTYSFLDESFDALYRAELRLNTLVSVFSVLAVLIACMGLLGLSAFMAEQKAKEIGIRKTLGASVGNIVSLLTGDFIKWVGLAIVIAIPCAYYAMSKWLQTFQYKVEVRPVFFVGAGAIVFLLVLLTTGWKSIQAALQNPVDVLKNN